MKINNSNRLVLLCVAVALAACGLLLSLPTTPIIVLAVIAAFCLVFPRDMMKNIRVLVWIFFIAVSLLLVGFSYNTQGFVVTFVSANSTLSNIAVGEIIHSINDVAVTAASFDQKYYGTIKIDTDHGQKFDRANGTLGVQVEEVPSSNLEFGLDLKGGVRAVIEPNTTDNSTIEQIIATLQTRINVYGLREAVFRPMYYEGKGFVEISMAGGNREELRNLMENQGRFEGKINFPLRIIGGAGTLKLDKAYILAVANGTLHVNNLDIKPGESFELNNVKIKLEGVESGRLNLTFDVIHGTDVKTVYFDPQRSRTEAVQGGYQWSFAIQLSPESAQRFAWATSNMDIIPGRASLDGPIEFYLDDILVDSLSISSQLKGKAETEILITGSAATRDLAVKDRARLQSILKSGALPTAVTIVQLDSISPTLGSGFLRSAMMAGFVALVGVIIVVGSRYRKPKIVLPMIIISASEILIILGIASVIGWTIDLPAIAGIIATIGSGINSQIMIIDQALRGEDKTATMREKLKDAFFVIFGAGGTVIAAMIPLMTIGFGLLRGFAITTIIGVLVGILVVRPAFGEIVKRIIKE